MSPSQQVEVSPDTMKRIRRVKGVTKMTEKVATGVLSGVVKVSGFFTSSAVKSKAGKKFFRLLPGEIALASLGCFQYGEQAGKATNEGLDAAGHAVGTAWTAFKIRKALNPKSSLKPTSIAKSAAKAAAAEYKSGKK
ncbi:Senescence-associated protein [Ancistrocladus abbreviatus]